MAELPEDGGALVRRLQDSVTNDSQSLAWRGSWQSLGIDDYLAWFRTLPTHLQEAVWQRWGAPEDDPKHRQGRLLIAGIRLGETFVGIQPARDIDDGPDADPTRSYHDTELVPPHSYLAFYLWLRDHYRVDAVVHVGKHGNLEWLPGKSTALSAECWPDIVLGALPHFYPFIVNDPGEGAQAKRRSQAVIIDHLMPPLARAELYGDMAELETLTDEYYQALGMDPKREALLRERILEHLRRTGIDRELGQAAGAVGEGSEGDDERLLNELDTYLCDIKESQIRHGLHVLGTLPPADKRAATLVAILRLPRGEEPQRRGLLHALADDLGLREPDQAGTRFDPLAAGAEPGKDPSHGCWPMAVRLPGAAPPTPASASNGSPSGWWPSTCSSRVAWTSWPGSIRRRRRCVATPATDSGRHAPWRRTGDRCAARWARRTLCAARAERCPQPRPARCLAHGAQLLRRR